MKYYIEEKYIREDSATQVRLHFQNDLIRKNKNNEN